MYMISGLATWCVRTIWEALSWGKFSYLPVCASACESMCMKISHGGEVSQVKISLESQISVYKAYGFFSNWELLSTLGETKGNRNS